MIIYVNLSGGMPRLRRVDLRGVDLGGVDGATNDADSATAASPARPISANSNISPSEGDVNGENATSLYMVLCKECIGDALMCSTRRLRHM